MSGAAKTETLKGVGIGWGSAYGPVARVHGAPPLPVEEKALPDRKWAIEQVLEAFRGVAQTLAHNSLAASGPVAERLNNAAQMAADPALHAEVIGGIESGEASVHAVDRVIEGFCTMFTSIGGSALDRVVDLRSVRDRVVARLLGEPEPGIPMLTEPSVIVAHDLSPADTASLQLTNVLAIVTEFGGPTSHAAIMASQLGIPFLVRVAGAGALTDGQLVAVDAAKGTLVVNPDSEVRHRLDERSVVLRALEKDHTPGATADGHRVELLANIGTMMAAQHAIRSGAEGVGLFRTEALYTHRAAPPSLAEQVAFYSGVLEKFGGRKVVVRTVDSAPELDLGTGGRVEERNPALGVRGFRLRRVAPEIMSSQLRALAQARHQTGVDLWVMAPMVTTAEEAREFAAVAEEHDLPTVGVMVEVPAAALRAEALLAQVDFAALGTNDLAQYTMAVDRLCGTLADLLDLWEPAVLDLVARTCQAGLRLRKPVGVCGESAADPLMALVLVGLGATSLSTSPAGVATVRFALSKHSLAQCRDMAQVALDATNAAEARAAVVSLLDPALPRQLAIEH